MNNKKLLTWAFMWGVLLSLFLVGCRVNNVENFDPNSPPILVEINPIITPPQEDSETVRITPTPSPVAVEDENVFYIPEDCQVSSYAVSPDNKWVVYDCIEPYQVWLIRFEGDSEPILLADDYKSTLSRGYSFDDEQSFWSPDSQKFILVNRENGSMLLFFAEQWDKPIVINNKWGERIQAPQWSPDSQKLSFISLADFATIHLITLDGAVKTIIEGIDYAFPQLYLEIRGWTEDSNHIIYEYNPDGTEQLWSLDAQSGQNDLLLESDTRLISWSSHEEELVFVTSPYSIDEPTIAEFQLFNINTHQLTLVDEWELPSGMRLPKRSPNGDFLAIGTENRIFIYEIDTKQLIKIEKAISSFYDFYWNPTSEYLLVEQDRKIDLIGVKEPEIKMLICNMDMSFTVFDENWSADGQSVLISASDADRNQYLEWLDTRNEDNTCNQ